MVTGKPVDRRAAAPGSHVEADTRLLRAAIDRVPAMIGYWDRDLRNVLANRPYLEWFGRTPEEILGIHISELLGPELFALNEPYMLEVLAGTPQRFDRTIVDASGSTRYSQADYIPDIHESGEVLGFFVLVTDVTARTEAELALVPLRAELERWATTDHLTGLANRRELDRRAELSLASGPEGAHGLIALLLVDLDGFKPVNDRYGHLAGDELLVNLSRRLAGVIRGGDVVARIGGDEFVVLLPSVADVEEACAVADRVVTLIREPVTEVSGADGPIGVTASVGIAVARPGHPVTLRSLLREADAGMYEAKGRGGDCATRPGAEPPTVTIL